MPTIKGKIIAESSVYRGNMKKTLFSREEKSARTPVQLLDVISAPAHDKGDAFIAGKDFKGNLSYTKLLTGLYYRLFGGTQEEIEDFLGNIYITCRFDDPRKVEERFFDLRMGIRINRDRMAMEQNANYKMEAVFKGTPFNFSLQYPDDFREEEKQKLAGLLHEMKQGRFWFGGGKSRGLGRLKLNVSDGDLTHCAPVTTESNTVVIPLVFTFPNSPGEPPRPLLVGWPFHPENAQNNTAGWIQAKEIPTVQHHLDQVGGIADGKIRDVDDRRIDDAFRNSHGRHCRTADGRSWKRSLFEPARLNDENQIAFLEWFQKKAKSELSQYCDFRVDARAHRVQHSQIGYDRIFMRMLQWQQNRYGWEAYIPGGTVKGACRVRAERILNTLLGNRIVWTGDEERGVSCTGEGSQWINYLFGEQGYESMVKFSDAYLVNPDDIGKHFCSMDAIAIDPATGEPVESSKMDFLYAYGKNFTFVSNIYIPNLRINENYDRFVLGLLFHLLKDFADGQIHFGGQKTSGMGWIKGQIGNIEVRAKKNSSLFGQFAIDPANTAQDGSWHCGKVEWQTMQQSSILKECHQFLKQKLLQPLDNPPTFPYQPQKSLVSHKAFGGRCGRLYCTLETRKPAHIKESGSPTIDELSSKQGWDFYHFSSPANHAIRDEASLLQLQREYGIPSKTLKGIVRRIYTLINDGQIRNVRDEKGREYNVLYSEASEKLFGFVENEVGYMGRLNFSFARMTQGNFVWYGMPYKYPHPIPPFAGLNFHKARIFPHSDLHDCKLYKEGQQFQETGDFVPCRCVDANSRFIFTVDFWNLSDKELKDLIWSIQLQGKLAHKIGKGKTLGFGSCTIAISQDVGHSWFYDWKNRYKAQELNQLGHVEISADFFAYTRNNTAEAELYRLLTLEEKR